MNYKEYRLTRLQPIDPDKSDSNFVVFRGANALPDDQVIKLTIKVRSEIFKQIRHAKNGKRHRDMPVQSVRVIHHPNGAEILVSAEIYDKIADKFNAMMRGLTNHMITQVAGQTPVTT